MLGGNLGGNQKKIVCLKFEFFITAGFDLF